MSVLLFVTRVRHLPTPDKTQMSELTFILAEAKTADCVCPPISTVLKVYKGFALTETRVLSMGRSVMFTSGSGGR